MTTNSSEPTGRGDAYQLPAPLLILHAAADYIEGLVTDARDTWRTRWHPDAGWSCTCPARTAACGHVLAVRSLVVIDRRSSSADVAVSPAEPTDETDRP